MYESRSIGCLRRVISGVGAVFGVALLSAGAASAADAVQLKSRLGDWCLDGPNGNNAAMMVNPCNGLKSQLWAFNSAGQIESIAFPGNCVNISDAADNTPVILSPCQANATTSVGILRPTVSSRVPSVPASTFSAAWRSLGLR